MLSILQAGINNRVLINSIEINGKFKINATSDNIKKTKIEGTIWYDSFELWFDTVNQTSILNINNISILEYLALKASASNLYTTQEVNDDDSMYDNALNDKADKSNAYLHTEIVKILW